MVRPVRPARPDAPPRARRWAGPPPLLVLVTLVGFLVAPLVDGEPEAAPRPETAVHVSSVPADTGSHTGPEVGAPERVSQRISTAPATPAAVRDARPATTRPRATPKAVRVGVASLTLDRTLAPAQAAGDIGRLVDRPGLDIVGWQGSARFGAELRALPGWGTRRVTSGDRGTSLAVSWRRERLVLVDAGLRQAGRRTLATVTLRHRDTGRLITVVDAHLPEQLAEGGTPGRRAPGRWVLGTAGDVTGRTGDARRIDGTSYLVLGTSPDARLVPTFRPEGRRVAVVYVDRGAHRDGRLRFAGRWVVRGFAGDHDALVARFVLS